MLINCVAYEDGRKLADIDRSTTSATTSAGPGCFVWVALKDATRRRARADAARSSACTTWRSRTPATATSGPRSRSTATRCSPCCTRLRSRPTDELDVGEVDIFVGPNFVLSARNRTEQRLPGRARARRARAAPAAHGAGYRALCADGRGGRPLLPGHRRARDASSRRSRSRSSARSSRARQHRGALRVKQKLTTLKHAVGAAARDRRQALRRARAAGVRGPRANTSATSTTT